MIITMVWRLGSHVKAGLGNLFEVAKGCKFLRLSITFNIVILCVVQSVYLSNDVLLLFTPYRKPSVFQCKAKCGVAPDIDKDPSVGPSDPKCCH